MPKEFLAILITEIVPEAVKENNINKTTIFITKCFFQKEDRADPVNIAKNTNTQESNLILSQSQG